MAESNIIKNFINSNMDIETTLQNLIVILYCLEDETSINWAKKELSGYDRDDLLPKYRNLKGRVLGSVTDGANIYSDIEFGTTHLHNDLRESLLKVNLRSSISTLISSRNSWEGLGKPIFPEYYYLLQNLIPGTNIIKASVDIDLTDVNNIISKVKLNILDILLFLEKKFGNLDKLNIDISKITEKELENIIKHIHIQIELYDNSINIGDNNKINKSNITTNKVNSISKFKKLVSFKKHKY
ncbi:hypothetical protein PV669_16540 [Clostridioides difficile]|nr:hypothetical protein [Clostridioides difficile]MCI0936819.1 hypothetical protein [Clostridioides difficile]MCL6901999.1 hypothetical protein [Clostridioides difficile]MCP3377821.1 hypothetical protein [Clostridioides difficile]MDE3493450.1 hypothetical protein [Clostridioides difficile]